jgi:hypothetical protein
VSATTAAAQYVNGRAPAGVDETGSLQSPPGGGFPAIAPVLSADAGNVDDFFRRYDTNNDGVVSREEAAQDPDLMRVFERADANRDGVLTRAEFQDAAVLAVNERRAGAAAGSGS